MAIIAMAGQKKDFPLTPLGLQQAVIPFVVDLGVQDGFEDKKVHQVAIFWELAAEMTGGDVDGLRYMLSQRFTLSMHEKSGLFKLVNAIYGKKLSKDDIKKGFDVEQLASCNGLINVVSYNKQDGTEGRKISSVVPLMAGMQPIQAITKVPPKWVNEARVKGGLEPLNLDNPPADGAPW